MDTNTAGSRVLPVWRTPLVAGTAPRRPGATEHGPKGRAQCRGSAGARVSYATGLPLLIS